MRNHIQLPNRMPRMKGKGSFLLQKGGAGDGSSYDGMDDYLATTGMKGSGMAINKKLEALSFLPKPPTKKAKNIKFNF